MNIHLILNIVGAVGFSAVTIILICLMWNGEFKNNLPTLYLYCPVAILCSFASAIYFLVEVLIGSKL